jgi:short subunit dehydrogenase-like uncharacterized protein
MTKPWLLYGANGYTGQLTAELAKKRGMTPILAGRDATKIRPLAEKLGFEHRVFSLDDPAALRQGLAGVAAVAHLAGPFSRTSKPMADACLAAGAHYLDITGEQAVFEALLARRDEAAKAGVAVITAVGFDVVPTDCLALMLKDELPDAVELEMAICGFGGAVASFSRGTLKTMLENLSLGSAARIDGKLRPVPFTWRTPTIPFARGARPTVTVPWGDITTAFYTTGIPNIAVYMASKPAMYRGINLVRPLLRSRLLVGALQQIVEWTVFGPKTQDRERGRTDLWGRVRNAKGETVSLTMVTPEGYTFTADSVLRSVERVLAGEVRPGAWTPAVAFGKDFVREMDGVTLFPPVRG